MYSRVYVEITNICNMKCSFCHGHDREPRRMSESEFSSVLDKLKEHTMYIYYHLMGEPLTHPSLPSFLQTARDKGFRSIITTNGTLLKKRGDELIPSGLHKINISIHSFEGRASAEHESYLRDVAEFADKASSAGTIVVFRLWNNGCDEENNAEALRVLRSALCGEWKENARGIRIREKIYLEYGERFGWPDMEASVQGEKFFCYGMRDHFGVLCDGTVVPCCLDSNGVIALGNIFTDDLNEILRSPRALAMVKGFEARCASEELCRRCAYAQRFV